MSEQPPWDFQEAIQRASAASSPISLAEIEHGERQAERPVDARDGRSTSQERSRRRTLLVVAALASALVLATVWLTREPTITTIVDAPPTTLPLQTTQQEAEAINASSATDRGWTWLDLDHPTPSPQRVGFLGQLTNGAYVALPTDRMGFNCESCVIYLGDGQRWTERTLEQFDGRRVLSASVRVGLLWVAVGDARGAVRENWVSNDAETWDRVSVDGSALSSSDRPIEDFVFLMDSGGGQRFLRHRDRIVTISYEGWLAWSSDNGRTFSTLPSPGEGAGRLGHAWANEDGFFVVDGDQLWTSTDSENWTALGGIKGLPRWERGIEDSSPDPYVVTTAAKELFTIAIGSRDLRIYRSVDQGLTWKEAASPSQFDGQNPVATVANGWILVGANSGEQVWTTDDGRTWYAFESGPADLVVDFVVNSAGVAYRQLQQGDVQTWQVTVPPR